MNIVSIELEGFTSHDQTRVEIPPRGIVTVMGPNGAGKSSLGPEAVAYGLWGCTLRRKWMPWREGVAGRIRIETDVVTVERTRTKGGRNGLAWSKEGTFESASKAQGELLRVVGSFDVWRRCCVFSSQDPGHFSGATDGERKKMLEQLLGLERFEVALVRCRKELGVATAARVRVDREVVALQERVVERAQRLKDAQDALADAPTIDTGAIEQRIADLRGRRERAQTALTAGKDQKATLVDLATDAQKRIDEAERALRQAERALGAVQGQAADLEKRAAFWDQDTCPTCAQALEGRRAEVLNGLGTDRERAAAAVTEAEKVVKAARRLVEAERKIKDKLSEDHRKLDEQLGELRRDVRDIEWQIDREEADLRAAREAGARRLSAEQRVADAEDALGKAEMALDDAQAALGEASRRVLVLEASEKVLDLRGVRAQMLGKVLPGIEAVANAWLAKIAKPGLRLCLRPYSEKADKSGVLDSIAFEIEGLGHSEGYDGCSGGERRRIDLAMVFALQEIEAGVSGRPPGTLHVDEAFDSLDEEGCDAVAVALEELARDRAIVVITHSRILADRLRPVRRIYVEGGRVSVR